MTEPTSSSVIDERIEKATVALKRVIAECGGTPPESAHDYLREILATIGDYEWRAVMGNTAERAADAGHVGQLAASATMRRLTGLWRWGINVLPPAQITDFYGWLALLDSAIDARTAPPARPMSLSMSLLAALREAVKPTHGLPERGLDSGVRREAADYAARAVADGRNAKRYLWLRECVRTKPGRLKAQALWWEYESRKQLDKAIDAEIGEEGT